jgi:hypothetical protein
MSRINQRLDRLEKAYKGMGGGVCRLCYGHPIARIKVMREQDPDGPGFRKTGECYLMEGEENRVTDDLRCVACGAEALQIHLMAIVGIGPEPTGRRVCAV